MDVKYKRQTMKMISKNEIMRKRLNSHCGAHFKVENINSTRGIAKEEEGSG